MNLQDSIIKINDNSADPTFTRVATCLKPVIINKLSVSREYGGSKKSQSRACIINEELRIIYIAH